MMLEILKIVIVPIAAALLHDCSEVRVAPGRAGAGELVNAVAVTGLFCLAVLSPLRATRVAAGLDLAGDRARPALPPGPVVAGVFYHRLTGLVFPRIPGFMPYLSMAGIVYFTTVTTDGAGRNNLLLVGGTLFLVAVLHNGAGYFLWLLAGAAGSARSVVVPPPSRSRSGFRTGGMASGLAGAMGKLATMGLAAGGLQPVVMNISGSLLANYWRRRGGGPERDAAGSKPE
jgi:BASS family bile acid:Na+ symporter